MYSWSELKDFITPEIDEGKGITIQKTDASSGWVYGRIVIRNNVVYGNGFAGVHVNYGVRVDVFHNTLYANTRSGKGNNVGISFSPCIDCVAANNIVVASNNWGGYALSSTSSDGNSSTWKSNLIVGSVDADVVTLSGTGAFIQVSNAGLENVDVANFRLISTSPAINVTSAVLALATSDFDGIVRDSHPDLGAFEYNIYSMGSSDSSGNTVSVRCVGFCTIKI